MYVIPLCKKVQVIFISQKKPAVSCVHLQCSLSPSPSALFLCMKSSMQIFMNIGINIAYQYLSKTMKWQIQPVSCARVIIYGKTKKIFKNIEDKNDITVKIFLMLQLYKTKPYKNQCCDFVSIVSFSNKLVNVLINNIYYQHFFKHCMSLVPLCYSV